MKVEAVNALLKTVEEPHENTLFLTANQEDDVLPTLRSRCHVSYFQTLSDELCAICVTAMCTATSCCFCDGSAGKLRRLLDDKDYFQAHQEILQDLAVFWKIQIRRRPELSRKYEAHELLEEMLDVLLRRAHSLARSRELPSVLSHLDFTRTVEHIESCKQGLKSNVNRKLLLDNLLLHFNP